MLLFFGVFLGLFLGFVFVLALGRFRLSGLKEAIKVLQRGPVVVMEVPEELSPEPFRLFKLLQREARFLDLIMEDMGEYSDEMVGGAVRPVLVKTRKALLDYVSLVPVMDLKEGDQVILEDGFDASGVQLVGNIGGSAPFKGVLWHPGWRVAGHKIPKAGPGVSGLIVEQAVVEV